MFWNTKFLHIEAQQFGILLHKFLYIETTKCIDIETLQKCFLHIEIIRLAARRLTTMLASTTISSDYTPFWYHEKNAENTFISW